MYLVLSNRLPPWTFRNDAISVVKTNPAINQNEYLFIQQNNEANYDEN